ISAMSSADRVIAQALARSATCSGRDALAIGATMLGRAINHARAIWVGLAVWPSATRSNAVMIFSPCRLRYLLTAALRLLAAISLSVRYLPVRKPEASA